MSKSNLMESAAEILNKSKAQAGSEPFGVGKTQVKTPGQEVQDLGTAGHKTTDRHNKFRYPWEFSTHLTEHIYKVR